MVVTSVSLLRTCHNIEDKFGFEEMSEKGDDKGDKLFTRTDSKGLLVS